jgi:hypothetical protein
LIVDFLTTGCLPFTTRCSWGLECPNWVDAAEKGLSMSPARNYRISGADILNRSCAFDADLESILLGDPPKILFQQHRSLADSPHVPEQQRTLRLTQN